MSSPTPELPPAGRVTLLTKPEYEWEKRKYDVNEGPAVLIRNGRVFMTFSASAIDANYCLGLLTASADCGSARSEVLDEVSRAGVPQQRGQRHLRPGPQQLHDHARRQDRHLRVPRARIPRHPGQRARGPEPPHARAGAALEGGRHAGLRRRRKPTAARWRRSRCTAIRFSTAPPIRW